MVNITFKFFKTQGKDRRCTLEKLSNCASFSKSKVKVIVLMHAILLKVSFFLIHETIFRVKICLNKKSMILYCKYILRKFIWLMQKPNNFSINSYDLNTRPVGFFMTLHRPWTLALQVPSFFGDQVKSILTLTADISSHTSRSV